MKNRITGTRVAASASFRRALAKAAEYAKNPPKLNRLLDRAMRKANERRGPLGEVWERLMASLRLLRAYAGGGYRDLPWNSLISIIAGVLYFVIPTDMIPDFLLGWGYIDDAALLGWIVGSLKSDIDRFLEWEQNTAADAANELQEPPHE